MELCAWLARFKNVNMFNKYDCRCRSSEVDDVCSKLTRLPNTAQTLTPSEPVKIVILKCNLKNYYFFLNIFLLSQVNSPTMESANITEEMSPLSVPRKRKSAQMHFKGGSLCPGGEIYDGSVYPWCNRNLRTYHCLFHSCAENSWQKLWLNWSQTKGETMFIQLTISV